MIQIRPVSDLRNKYPEIEELVLKEDEAVYLTKNGYGLMVVMSLEKYSNLIKEVELEKLLEMKFGNINIDDILYETESILESSNIKYLDHEKVFSDIRGKINEPK